MKRRAVIYTADAAFDLTQIGQWLVEVASEEIAIRFTTRIVENVRRLEHVSERGTIQDVDRGLRVIGILPTVSVAFSVEEDAVLVHRILYGGKAWP